MIGQMGARRAACAATTLALTAVVAGCVSHPRAGDTRPPPCVSATFSPYHLAYPILNVVVEQKVVPHLGVAEEIGVGSHASAAIGQLGAHVRYYWANAFDGGYFGPFTRADLITYPGPQAVLTWDSDALDATHLFSGDVGDTRANGRSSLVSGVELGDKVIATGIYGDGSESRFWRGFTVDLSLQLGYLHLIGDSPYGPSPNAMFMGDHIAFLLGVRLGWSL